MMIGDSLGVPLQLAFDDGDVVIPNYYAKVADNNSAIPQDRVFLTYRFFNDVRTFQSVNMSSASNEVRDLSLIELGMEKTFHDGLISADLILPFMNSPVEDAVFWPGQTTPQQDMQLQDLAFGLKGILLSSGKSTLTSGFRVEAPTGQRFSAFGDEGTEIVDNDVWAVTPYLAYLNELNHDTFFQSFIAYRMQTGGNGDRRPFATTEEVREPAYLNLDAQLGRWLFRNNGGRGITGMQALIELHYTTTDAPEPRGGANLTTFNGGSRDYLNLTTGLTTLINNNLTVTTAMSFPLRNGSNPSNSGDGATFDHPSPSDRNYDWEFLLQVNYFFNQSWR